jgi:hypothetical protein
MRPYLFFLTYCHNIYKHKHAHHHITTPHILILGVKIEQRLNLQLIFPGIRGLPSGGPSELLGHVASSTHTFDAPTASDRQHRTRVEINSVFVEEGKRDATRVQLRVEKPLADLLTPARSCRHPLNNDQRRARARACGGKNG